MVRRLWGLSDDRVLIAVRGGAAAEEDERDVAGVEELVLRTRRMTAQSPTLTSVLLVTDPQAAFARD